MAVRRISFVPAFKPTAYLPGSGAGAPFPLQSPRSQFFLGGRHAFHAGVSDIGLEPGDRVLVPAYHHGAEIEALVRAGLSVVYYGTTSDLGPDPDELADLVGPRCRALLLIHVLGFPQEAGFWRTWCDDRGLLLIENAAHAWSASVGGQPVGSYGDLSIFCPYKTLALPRISASVSRDLTGHGPPVQGRDPGDSGVLHRSWIAAAERLSRAAAVSGPASVWDPNLSLGDGTCRPGLLARFLLNRTTEDPAVIRRENYRLLLEELSDLVPEPFDVLPEGASPLGFPVMTTDKAALLERLAKFSVDGVDLWPTPHPSLPADKAAPAAHRRGTTVALPVHQALAAEDLERIADAARPSRGPRQELHLAQTGDFEELRDEWSRLALSTRNIFATWEWNRTWWEHFGRGRPLALTTLRDGRAALRAVLPLYLAVERPLRIARFLGHVAGDQLQPVCAPSDRAQVGRSLRGLVAGAGWDLLLAERLPAADAWAKRLSGRTLRRESSPVLFLDGSWDQATSVWSPRFRSQLRRQERRIRADHDLRITTIDDRADLDPALDAFFDLHRARWPEGTKFEEREPFHREFARRAFENGWLRLQITEADGIPVGAVLNFRYCGVEFGYQSGWDPKYADYSIGTIQLLEAIRSAHADGVREYRFLRGGESYKYRFADADAGLETVVVRRPSVSGAVAEAAIALTDTLPAQVRRRARSYA